MKAATKKNKALALLASYGLANDVVQQAAEKVVTSNEKEAQAEAVLAYVDRRGHGFHDITCKWCQRRFSVDINHVSYCSNNCRAAALRDIGIIWDPSKKDSERWQTDRPWGHIPLIVPPDALSLAESAVQLSQPTHIEAEELVPQS